MNFRWRIEGVHDKIIPVGEIVCGLQIRGKRPHSVEVSYEELKYLLNNPRYAETILLSLRRYSR